MRFDGQIGEQLECAYAVNNTGGTLIPITNRCINSIPSIERVKSTKDNRTASWVLFQLTVTGLLALALLIIYSAKAALSERVVYAVHLNHVVTRILHYID